MPEQTEVEKQPLSRNQARKLLVAALRSGEFLQGFSTLKEPKRNMDTGELTGVFGLCCLGVGAE